MAGIRCGRGLQPRPEPIGIPGIRVGRCPELCLSLVTSKQVGLPSAINPPGAIPMGLATIVNGFLVRDGAALQRPLGCFGERRTDALILSPDR
jgi:hypothetical protein